MYIKMLIFVAVVSVGQLSFSQDCVNGQCPRPLPSMLRETVQLPKEAVVKVVQAQPVQRLVAARPVRRVFGLFRCRCR